MANYSINPNGALDTAGELAAVTAKLETSLETLRASVVRFTAANAGQAPEAYNAAQGLWNQGQQEMNASLAQGQAALIHIAEQYVLSDNKGAAVFGGSV